MILYALRFSALALLMLAPSAGWSLQPALSGRNLQMAKAARVAQSRGAHCAQEHGHCAFKGQGRVYYGANGQFFVKTASDGIGCNNGVFGDPIVGVVKSCFVEILGPKLVNAPKGIHCARENGQCQFNGPGKVYYGANGRFFVKKAGNGIGCNNQVFGDPIVGTVKDCFVKTRGSVLVSSSKGQYCAQKNGHCKFNGKATVYYGANGKFFAKRARNGIKCNNSVFGDPIVGVVKSCFVSQ